MEISSKESDYYTDLQSSVISLLRFPLACLVVMIHIYGSSVYGHFSGRWNGGVFDFFHILFAQGICRIAVPAFFMISGYLYFSKLSSWSNKEYLNKQKKRVKSLLIPYIIWNAITIIALVTVKGIEAKIGDGDFSFASFWNNHGGLRLFWDNNQLGYDKTKNILGITMINYFPINGPLWFMRDLLVVTVMSPIIHFLVKKFNHSFIIAATVLMLFNVWIPLNGFSSLAFVFFSWGAYLRLNGKNLVLFCKSFKPLSYILSSILLLCCVLSYQTNDLLYSIIQRVFVLFGSAAAINIASGLIEKKKIIPSETLAKSSFVIFAAQALYLISLSTYLVNRLLPWDCAILGIIRYIVSTGIVAFLCVLLYITMKKYIPKISSFIIGGR